MSRFPDFETNAMKERFLANASPETVYAYLDEKCDGVLGMFSEHPLSADFQKLLYEKNEPIIDLALAKFSNQDSIKKEIFARGDEALTTALFLNSYNFGLFDPNHPTWIEEDELVSLLQSCSKEILRAYFTNPTFAPRGLTHLFEKSHVFARLSEERYSICVCFGLLNPYLHKPRKESHDGFTDYMESEPFEKAWNLLITLENTPLNACILAEGLEKIVEFHVPVDLSPIDGGETKFKKSSLTELQYDAHWLENQTIKFVNYVFEKWSCKNSDHENTRFENGEENSDYQDLRRIVAERSTPTAFSYHEQLQRFLSDHTDNSVRAGYYRRFGIESKSAVEYENYLQKDGKLFIQNFVYNSSAYARYNKEVVKKFHDLVHFDLNEDNFGMSDNDISILESQYSIEQQECFKLDSFRYPVYDGLGEEEVNEDDKEFLQRSGLTGFKDIKRYVDRIKVELDALSDDPPKQKSSAVFLLLSEMVDRLNDNLIQTTRSIQESFDHIEKIRISRMQEWEKGLKWGISALLAIWAISWGIRELF